MKLRRTKNMRAARGARGRRARTRKRQRGGENNDTAAPAEVDKITQLFNDLIEEKNKIDTAGSTIESINSSNDDNDTKRDKIKEENKTIKKSQEEIEKILRKIKEIQDTENGPSPKKTIELRKMAFAHEPGSKVPTVYFSTYYPTPEQMIKMGVSEDDTVINPYLQFDEIDQLMDMKRAAIKYIPESLYYKLEGSTPQKWRRSTKKANKDTDWNKVKKNVSDTAMSIGRTVANGTIAGVSSVATGATYMGNTAVNGVSSAATSATNMGNTAVNGVSSAATSATNMGNMAVKKLKSAVKSKNKSSVSGTVSFGTTFLPREQKNTHTKKAWFSSKKK